MHKRDKKKHHIMRYRLIDGAWWKFSPEGREAFEKALRRKNEKESRVH